MGAGLLECTDMDFLSHLLWAYVLFHRQPWAELGMVFCLLPDLFWAIPLIGLRIRHLRKKIPYVEENDIQTRALYRASHSLVTLAVAFLVSYFFFGVNAASGIGAGWLLHIIMDVGTQKGGIVNGIRLFHPFSQWHIPAPIWWREQMRKRPWIYAVNLGLAAIVYYAFG